MVDKKQLDDTKLEYYWLNEEDIENLKSEKTYSSEEVDKMLYIRDLLAKVGIYVDDFDKFEKIIEGLEMYDEVKNV